MKILMLSIDKGLLGRGQLGDVIERHKKYGEFVEKLDIIVFCKFGFSENKISDKVVAYPTNSKNKLNYFFSGLWLGKKLFKENKYDLIVAQEPFLVGLVGYLLKKKFRSKLLIHFHGDFWQNHNWLKKSWLNIIFLLISKFNVSQADGIRVMNQGQKDKLGKYKDKARVISTPVNLENFSQPAQSISDKVRVDNNCLSKKIVLHVSRYDQVKDFETLLKTFSVLYKTNKNIMLWQIGAGDKLKSEYDGFEFGSKKFRSIFQDPNVIYNMLFFDHIDLNRLTNYYHAVDAVVLSSKSESFGKVLVEANACGKPVVSTATTGAKEIIQDGYNGFLVPVGDVQALAEKILYLLNNPKKAKEMGENGRNLVYKRFSGEVNTKRIINFWQEIISR